MLLILRKMKQRSFGNAEFRKYLLYAVGEMALIIVGILIALQIDNWNANKLQQKALNSYLHTVAKNIGSDLVSVNEVRSLRIEARELGNRLLVFGPPSQYYSVPELSFISEALNALSLRYEFHPSNSGFEALKSSGTLDQMQGADIERLLYDYYDTVARIVGREEDHNEMIGRLIMQLRVRWPEQFARWELEGSHTLTHERIESIQPAVQRLMQGSAAGDLVENAQSVGPLLNEYDKLERLGKAFQWLVENEAMMLDEAATEILEGIYAPRSGIGQPKVIVDGQVAWHSYGLLSADASDQRVSYQSDSVGMESPFSFDSMRRIGDRLHIDYHGDVAWAGIWFNAGMSYNNSPDYSMYDTLILEMKGDIGGENVFINMEDRDDPADGSSTRYELQLSDEWQHYEIDLAEFETADLSILSVPFGFVFFEEPVAFSIRTAEFVKAN